MSSTLAPPRTSSPRFASRIERIGSENAFKIGPHIAKVESKGRRVIKCNLGEPDFPLPKHIAEEIKRQVDADMTHYTDPQGILAFREAIARDVSAKRGIEVTPDRVVVFPGAKPPIGFCQEAYCDPGDEVIYPSPGFPIYESFTRYVGATPVPLHLNEETGFNFTGSDLEPLITEKTRLIFLNFPSNPTGGLASEEQLREIAEVILQSAPPDVRVYSDEVYENIIFDGGKHHSIASMPGMAERTIIVSGASKTYSWTGGRLGWAVFPTAQEAAVFKNLNINYFSCVPPYNQLAAKLAIESPLSAPAIAAMVDSFERRRDVVVAGLEYIDGIRCQKPKGAFYVFPNIEGACQDVGAIDAWNAMETKEKETTSPSTLFQMFLLYRYAVATMDRRSFGAIGSTGKHYLRLSIATAQDDLEEALQRIETAAADPKGFAEFMKDGLHRY